MTGYNRIDAQKIFNRSEAMTPDYVVVLDETLFGPMVTEGIKVGGVILVNTASPEKYPSTEQYRVAAIDATSLALATLGRPITNVPMLGALVALTGIVTKESVENSLKEVMSEANREKNLEVFGKAYLQMKGGV